MTEAKLKEAQSHVREAQKWYSILNFASSIMGK